MAKYPEPLLQGMLFVSFYEDGSIRLASMIPPKSSKTGAWDNIAKIHLTAEDIATKAHEDHAASFARQLTSRLTSMVEISDTPTPIAEIELAALPEDEHPTIVVRSCRQLGCRGRVSVVHGNGVVCYAHRQHKEA